MQSILSESKRHKSKLLEVKKAKSITTIKKDVNIFA